MSELVEPLAGGDFTEAVRQVHRWVDTGYYPGAGLVIGRRGEVLLIDPDGRVIHISSPSWAGTYPWVDEQRGVYGVLVTHVDLDGPAWEAGFNPFYSGATLADLVAAAIDRRA